MKMHSRCAKAKKRYYKEIIKGGAIMCKKMIIMIFAAIVMTITISSVSVEAASKKSIAIAEKKLKKKGKSLKKKNKYNEYKLKDINGDKIPELFFSYHGGARGGLKIYRYDSKSKKVKKVKTFDSYNRVYKNKDQIIVLTSNGARDNEYSTYEYKKGKLKKVMSYKSVSGSDDNVIFYRNNSVIEIEEYINYTNDVENLSIII